MESEVTTGKLMCRGGSVRNKILNVTFGWLPPSEKLVKTEKVRTKNMVQPSYLGEEITKTDVGIPTLGSINTEKLDVPNRVQPKVPTFRY